jgi:hypothetical protein
MLGRMLSPDPYVADGTYSQDFNRYSYARNNPLSYPDPSGEFIFSALLPGVGIFIDAALWGAVIGGAGYTASVAFSDGGFNNWDNGSFWKSVGIGAISGVATAGIGEIFGAVGSNGITGELMRAQFHGVANGTISEFSGGSFWQGYAAGALGSAAGSAFMMYGGSFANSSLGTYAFSAAAGGVGAAATGGNFWEGAAIGVMGAGLNHLQSVVDDAGRRYFANKKAAYKYMWDNSFENGSPKREVSGWELENGNIVVEPYGDNTVTKSTNSLLEMKGGKGLYSEYNGKIYKIKTNIHTHPSMDPTGGIGLYKTSASDIRMYQTINKPLTILYNRTAYSAWFTKGRWGWSNKGTW